MRFGPVAMAACVLVALPVAVSAQNAPAATKSSSASASMDCETGPVTRTYGGSDWLVYSCTDGSTLVFVSAPGSPAMPFWFMSAFVDGTYQVTGEGTGPKSATDPAYDQISRMSPTDRDALLSATKSAQTANS